MHPAITAIIVVLIAFPIIGGVGIHMIDDWDKKRAEKNGWPEPGSNVRHGRKRR